MVDGTKRIASVGLAQARPNQMGAAWELHDFMQSCMNCVNFVHAGHVMQT